MGYSGNMMESGTEKWQADYALRARELDLKERELGLREREHNRGRWSNPLVVAILVAGLAAGGNAVVSLVNGQQAFRLEKVKQDATLILESIKTYEPDKAAGNLRLLVDVGLISDRETNASVRAFLDGRMPGQGPVLPPAYLVARRKLADGLNRKFCSMPNSFCDVEEPSVMSPLLVSTPTISPSQHRLLGGNALAHRGRKSDVGELFFGPPILPARFVSPFAS